MLQTGTRQFVLRKLLSVMRFGTLIFSEMYVMR